MHIGEDQAPNKQLFVFSFGNQNESGFQNHQKEQGFSNKRDFVLSLFQKLKYVNQNNKEENTIKDESKQLIKKQSPFTKIQTKNIIRSTANSNTQQSIVSSSTKNFINHYINLSQSVNNCEEKEVSQWNVGIEMIKSIKVEQDQENQNGQKILKNNKDQALSSFKVYQIFGICLIVLLIFMIL